MSESLNIKWQTVENHWKSCENKYENEGVQKFQKTWIPPEVFGTADSVPNDPEEIMKDLVKHRNLIVGDNFFADISKKFLESDGKEEKRINELLKAGTFLLVRQKALHVSEWKNKKEVDLGGGTFCLFKANSGLKFVLFPANSKKPIVFKCGLKNWIFIAENMVVLNVDDTMLTLDFQDRKFSATEILDAFNYVGQDLIHIYGDSPEDQLNVRKLLRTDNKATILFLLNKLKNDESEVDFGKYCFGVGIQNYIRYVFLVGQAVFEASLKFRVSQKTEELCAEILEDFVVLQTIAPFCCCSKNIMSHKAANKQMTSILNASTVIKSCQRLHKCSSLYLEFWERICHVRESIENKFPLVDEPERIKDGIEDQNLKDIKTKIMEDQNKSRVDGHSPVSCLKKAPHFNLIARMCDQLNSSAKDLSLFDSLDKLLHVTEEGDVFDIINQNIKTEYQTMEGETIEKNLSKFCGNLFGDDCTNLKTREGWSMVSTLRPDRSIDKKRVAVFAKAILLKISHCHNILMEMKDGAKEYLDFDRVLWNKLWGIRRSLGPLSRHPTGDEEGGAVDSTSSSRSSYEIVEENGNDDESIPEHWKRCPNYAEAEFEKEKEVGKGSFGRCSIFVHSALGRIIIKEYQTTNDWKMNKKEIDMLIKLQNNKNIVRLHGFFYSQPEYCGQFPQGIVLEYVELTLHNVIHDVKGHVFDYNYTLKEAFKRMRGLANALKAMHAVGVLHRDLKPKNILVKYRGNIRICDFGTAGELLKTRNDTFYGTREYASPEMHQGNLTHNEKTDVYSMAITMWEEVHRRLPFHEMKTYGALRQHVLDGGRLDIDEHTCPQQLAAIIKKAWSTDPNDRPSMDVMEKLIDELLELPDVTLQTIVPGAK